MKELKLIPDKKYSEEEKQTIINEWRKCGITMYNKDQWISVEDRLPEEGDLVLISDGRSVYYAEKRPVGIWDYQIAENYDFDSNSFVINAMEEKHVTHWMPLPKPPCGNNLQET